MLLMLSADRPIRVILVRPASFVEHLPICQHTPIQPLTLAAVVENQKTHPSQKRAQVLRRFRR